MTKHSRQYYAQIESMLGEWMERELTTAVNVRGLGYQSTTQEGRLAKGELPSIGKHTHKKSVPIFDTSPRFKSIWRVVKLNKERWMLAYCLYGIPIINPGKHSQQALMQEYCMHVGCSERTAWRRRKEMLDAVIMEINTRQMAETA